MSSSLCAPAMDLSGVGNGFHPTPAPIHLQFTIKSFRKISMLASWENVSCYIMLHHVHVTCYIMYMLHHVQVFFLRYLLKRKRTPARNLDVSGLVQFSSVAQLFSTLCDPMDCSTLGFPLHHQFPRLAETHVHWVGDAIQPSHPLLSPSPAFNLSIRVFSNESVLCITWPKSWNFSFSISPSNEYSGLTSFRIDWLDLLAVQGTLKSLLQHHSSKASILRHSTFFIVQFSHPYMTTGKTIALTRRTFVGKVMSLLFAI